MRCRYCFYCDVAAHREERSARVMGEDVASAIIDRALAVASDAHISFAFQGGEPTLAGLDFFHSFVARVEEGRENQRVSWALQTNGYLIEEDWAEFFREHGFLIGVSVDAYRDLHDSMRPDAHGAATYARVMSGVRLLRERGGGVHLAVAHEGVERDVDLAAADVTVAHGLGKRFPCEIIGAPARVESVAKAHIHRVRPVLHRRDDGVEVARGRQQFQHRPTPSYSHTYSIIAQQVLLLQVNFHAIM